MKEHVVKCPGCGAYVDILEDRKIQFCQYCGTKIALTENTNVSDSYNDIDIGNTGDLLGIGKAVNSITSIYNNKIMSQERDKQRQHEKELLHEKFLQEHPEERIKEQKKEKKFIIGLIIMLIVLFGFMFIMAALESK